MRSLTVFDPKKVFTEVIKQESAATQQILAFKLAMLLTTSTAQVRRCKHIKFFSTRTLYARTFNFQCQALKNEGYPQWIVSLGMFAKKISN